MCIRDRSRLRRLLEHLRPGEPMIETVRGQGYRLVAPVERLSSTGRPGPRGTG